jgi:hypothetical protein
MRSSPRSVQFVSALAFACGALFAAMAHAEDPPRCPAEMRLEAGRCVFVISGQIQRPQVFTLTGRGEHGWTAAAPAPAAQRQAVVDATRRAPF